MILQLDTVFSAKWEKKVSKYLLLADISIQWSGPFYRSSISKHITPTSYTLYYTSQHTQNFQGHVLRISHLHLHDWRFLTANLSNTTIKKSLTDISTSTFPSSSPSSACSSNVLIYSTVKIFSSGQNFFLGLFSFSVSLLLILVLLIIIPLIQILLIIIALIVQLLGVVLITFALTHLSWAIFRSLYIHLDDFDNSVFFVDGRFRREPHGMPMRRIRCRSSGLRVSVTPDDSFSGLGFMLSSIRFWIGLNCCLVQQPWSRWLACKPCGHQPQQIPETKVTENFLCGRWQV